MKLHLLGFPHTQVSKDFSICAYTSKMYKFMKMFPETILYTNEGSEGEYVQIYSKEDTQELFGDLEWYKKGEYYKVDFDYRLSYWQGFNNRVVYELKKRVEPGDLILTFAGLAQKQIADAFPDNAFVEAGIGYEGVFSNFRVYESYAWMHHLYGKYGVNDGRFFDCVIPNYFEVEDFPFSIIKEDYLLFMSRPIERKGIEIVREIAKQGHKVIAAGAEELKGNNIEWVGYADTKKRGELMSKAKALLCPTLYIGPFEGVTVEANLCGTPIITTDWGSFAENNIHGLTGYRARTLGEFLWAVDHCATLDPEKIRDYAVKNFSLTRVKQMYESYFNQLATLKDKGWYTTTNEDESMRYIKF